MLITPEIEKQKWPKMKVQFKVPAGIKSLMVNNHLVSCWAKKKNWKFFGYLFLQGMIKDIYSTNPVLVKFYNSHNRQSFGLIILLLILVFYVIYKSAVRDIEAG